MVLKPNKRGAPTIKPMTLTPFWHRRMCEAIAVFCLLIIGLFAWSTLSGISDQASRFYVSPLAAGISAGAIILAGLSYFVVPEAFRTKTVYAAYWVLLAAIAALTTMTGGSNSPFLATWMIVVIFAGIFGPTTLGILFVGINAYFGYTLFTDHPSSASILSFVLAGELPILVSYILWHGKSSNEKTKERAYYDLANELDQISSKAEVVISAISDGVIAVNNQGQIELINPAAQKIVGWGHQDALNLNYKSVLQLLTKDGKEIDKSTDPVFDVLATNQPVKRNDLQLQTNSGKKLLIEIVVSPIGRMGSGAIIVFRDVTKEQAEEKAQAEFISTASHEMRTPVASIEGYLGLALNPATAKIDDKARDFITKAHSAAEHLGRLFQDLLDVTKAEDGRLSNNPKAIDVVSFMGEIVEGLKPKADEKKLRLFFKPGDGGDHGVQNLEPVFYVNVDQDHMREVMSNLIENAIKYTPAGEVVIDVKGDSSHVVVSISDSGIGIPTEDIPHLFQKFYRVDNSDTREIGGTGLGLYLCRRLVESMDGRIWVDSEYKKGSTFSVELPRITHEEAMHLIEAASAEVGSVKVDNVVAYVQTDEDDDRPTAEERAQALATPIIVDHPKTSIAPEQGVTAPAPAAVTAPAAATQPADKSDPEFVNPLMGVDAPKASADQPKTQHVAMVLPPAMQAVKSNFQKAAAQMSATAPAPTPAPAASPSPAAPAPSAAPATPTPRVAPVQASAPASAAPPPPVTTQAPRPVVTAPVAPPVPTPPRQSAPAVAGSVAPLTVPERQKT